MKKSRLPLHRAGYWGGFKWVCFAVSLPPLEYGCRHIPYPFTAPATTPEMIYF